MRYLGRFSQTLTVRIRELAERYATPLTQLTDEVATLTAHVEEHLKKWGRYELMDLSTCVEYQ